MKALRHQRTIPEPLGTLNQISRKVHVAAVHPGVRLAIAPRLTIRQARIFEKLAALIDARLRSLEAEFMVSRWRRPAPERASPLRGLCDANITFLPPESKLPVVLESISTKIGLWESLAALTPWTITVKTTANSSLKRRMLTRR